MSTINFNDKIFAQEVLEKYTRRMRPLTQFARDFSNEARKVGDAIAVPRIDSVTVTTFAQANNGGSPYEGTGGEINAITVNLNNRHIATVDFEDIQVLNHSPARAENFQNILAKDLASRAFDTVLSIVTPGTFGTAVTSVTIGGFGSTHIRALRTALVKANAPMDSAVLWANPDLYDRFLADSNVTKSLEYGSPDAIRDALVPRLLGFNVFEINDLPLNGVSLVGFGACADAIAIASRMVVPQATSAYESYLEMFDPETGLGFTYRRHYNPGKGKMFINLETLFGFAAGITPGLKLLTRTD